MNTSAKVAVQSVRRLLRHPRLSGRVIDHFSALEVSYKTSGLLPCTHVHTLLVTKPMTAGRHYIGEAEWIRLWEASCPIARKRDPAVRLTRKGKRAKVNPSIDVRQVMYHPDPDDPDQERSGPTQTGKAIGYATKLASVDTAVEHFRELLLHPEDFLHRQESLAGTTRFFGGLHLR